MPWPYLVYDALVAERGWLPGRGDVSFGRHDDVSLNPPAQPPEVLPVPELGQEDLTADDHLAVTTGKDAPDSDDLPIPPQDPAWVPESVVDEDGDTV